ncbi:MAG: tRNA uridine(34) 5-carboxymethylaminomethyl modification radical SAM/GNAT enzyme Elp3 [Patescibacteria group bacterium]
MLSKDLKTKKAIKELLAKKIKTRDDLMMAKRGLCKKYGIEMLKNSDILKLAGKKKEVLNSLLRKRSIRTLSGIAPVAVLTKPFACPGKCVYCPTVDDVPKSYLPNEPAVMRAIKCEYDQYKQVQYRLRALEANGHHPTKIELIVIGGTWSVFPEEYKYWYILNCFKAANDYANSKKQPASTRSCSSTRGGEARNKKISEKLKFETLKKKLGEEQKKNERAKYKLIGVTLETRPDYINEKELLEMRELGCTRVELGAQAIDDEILKLNRRGNDVKDIADATKFLHDFGFKVTYHLMPGLPGSSPKKDLAMFKQLFGDERFQPDQIKFYPTVVTEGSLLYEWWKKGEYTPYPDEVLQQLIIDCKAVIPPYVRIIRLVRDIPSESIVAGNIITNLRQIMQARGIECNCIRCREARDKQLTINNSRLTKIEYDASNGKEVFMQIESKDGKILFGFLRLRLPSRLSRQSPATAYNALRGAAMVRELHVYGELVSVGGNKKTQHAGLGAKLLKEAERIVKKAGYEKLAIISGVGARGYYKKSGYKLEDSYMVKKIK